MINSPNNKILITSAQITMILLFGILTGCAKSIDKNLVDKGKMYFSEGKYKQAIAELTQALKINPNNTEAYFARGLAYHNFGLQYMTKDSSDPDIASHNFDLAVLDFNKVIKKFPNSFEFYVDRGACYADKGDVGKAISDYSRVIELNPNYADAYNVRAMQYYKIQEYEKSWKDAQKAEALGYKFDPDFIEALKKASGRDK